MVNGQFGWGDSVTKENLKNILAAVRDIINRSSEIGLRKAQSAEEKSYKAQTTAETAQITAETAQTTAETAQITAETAQTAAETAQTTAGQKMSATNPNGVGTFCMTGEIGRLYSNQNQASGEASFAHGGYLSGRTGCRASGYASHAEGAATKATGQSSHAEGESTEAIGRASHAEGRETIVNGDYCHVEGKFNIYDANGKYLHIIGNGTGHNSRSNAETLDHDGNVWFAGTIEGTALILKSSTAGSTKKYKITVDDAGAISATEVT